MPRFLIPFCLAAVAVCLPATAVAEPAAAEPEAAPTISRDYESEPKAATVIDVLKADELVLDTGDKVRLIGIDAPIAHFNQRTGDYYGKAGFDYVVAAVKDKQVTLEYDAQPRDKFRRLLGYVRLADGKLLNQELIRTGAAVAACFPPNTARCGEFAATQNEALGAKRGIWNIDTTAWPKIRPSASIETTATVKFIQDGDTIVLDNGKLVRYIGIDAPESTESDRKGGVGNPAFELNKLLVLGKEIRMEFDRKLKDPRDRYLAYVYVQDRGNEIFVNQVLVGEGVAWVAAFPPNTTRIDTLLEAQQAAYNARRGMWNFDGTGTTTTRTAPPAEPDLFDIDPASLPEIAPE